MCGIAGILARTRPVDETSLRHALRALRHRGPDGAGTWVAPDRSVGLGHARLSIIDLEGGQQPIANEDGSVQAVVNGEFYDFERIRSELETRGHRFRTRSDSEILVHLYEERGADCLRELRGEFAFLLWDARNRVLLAARDRFGIRPLVWTQTSEALLFASEAKALLAAGVAARWDEGAFFHAASHQYLPPDRTLFQGISQLPPGHLLLAADDRVQVRRYWDQDYPRLAERPAEVDERALISELRARLEEAVRLRLRADVPVACQLSGGLDSSVVAGLAMRHLSRPLECFTIAFDEASYDELAIAQETADHIGARLHPVRVTQADLVDHLADAVHQGEGLVINGHITAKFLLSRAVRDAGFKVALTGEGSDEVLAGYPHLRRDLWIAEAKAGDREAQALLARLHETNLASAGVQLPEGESLPLHAVERRLGFVPSFLEAKGTLGLRIHRALDEGFRRRFAARDAYALLLDGFDVAGQLAGRHAVEQSLYLWSKLSLAQYILRTLGDAMELAHAVEGRLPFLDHHVFELARTLPMSLKIRGTVEKFALREATRDVLTETVYRRQKHPFMAPPLTRFTGGRVDAFVQDTLRSPRFSTLPFFDRDRLLALVDQLPAMGPRERTAAEPVVMTALSAAILHERFHL